MDRTGEVDHSDDSTDASAAIIDEVLPLPRGRRHGIALCLSGGGYRAALFHLGALGRLNELGILTQVTTITAVSGGSIVAAQLARTASTWPEAGAVIPSWDQDVVRPLRAFMRRNIRREPLVRRLLPWNWRDETTAVTRLAAQYQRYLLPHRFAALARRPRFVFCATDMTFGVNWVFDTGHPPASKGRFGDYQAGYISPPPDWPVGRIVAASSCFPPLFDPLPVGLPAERYTRGKYRKPDREALVRELRLSDGGLYDNMGLEPVWKDHETVLVSDGGGVFGQVRDAGFLWRLLRYPAIVDRQSRSLRRRWLIAGFLTEELRGTYWSVGSAAAHYPESVVGYSPSLVDEVISVIRTDLDAFSESEMNVLINHGYTMADTAIRSHAGWLAPDIGAPKVPHDEWLVEDRVRDALKESHQQTLLGRG